MPVNELHVRGALTSTNLLGGVTQCFVLVVRVVGDGSAGAELDAGQ